MSDLIDLDDLDDLPDEVLLEMQKMAVEPLWRKGRLDFLLDETQMKIQTAIKKSRNRQFYLLCSRRLGKSFTLVKIAFEMCLRKRGSRVLYLAPEGKDAADIVTDIAETILETCPDDLKPHYNAQEKVYTFKNGSIIRFKGVNGEKHERLRGGATHLVILDECGVMDDLDYVLNSIVKPMTMTTGGRILLATTPPRSPGHDSAAIYGRLLSRNATIKFTIRDNVRVPDVVKAEFLMDAGELPEDVDEILAGTKQAKTTTALREYFCEFVTDAHTAVLPEFTAAKPELIARVTPPPYFDAYVAMDPGFNDRTAVLLAWWDFKRGKLCIKRDGLLYQASTQDIADKIRGLEEAVWKDKEPYKRITDVDPRLVKDLREVHGLEFVQTEKQNSLGAINYVRTMIQAREIEIDPSCQDLIWQMEAATWNKKATDFERSKEDGHFDLVAALKYLCRGVEKDRNPYPADFGTPTATNFFVSPKLASKQRQIESRGAVKLLPNAPIIGKLAKPWTQRSGRR